MAHYEYFSPALILLQDELCNHPPAMSFIAANATGNTPEEKLAALCTYCDILVDDTFNPKELDSLYDLVTRKLYEMRTGLIITH